MKVTYTLTVDIDAGIVELEAKRRGRNFQATFEEIIGDLECRLSDSIRWRDGVTSVHSKVLRDVRAWEPKIVA